MKTIQPKDYSKTPSWFYVQFDPAWVRCANHKCNKLFAKEFIKGKRKCPSCKMDNKLCLPVKREVKK